MVRRSYTIQKVTATIYLLLGLLFVSSSARAQGGLDQRISELSQQIASKMSAKQKTTIAVVEFTDLQGNVTDFGRFLSEELMTRLYDSEKFKVIERQLLTKVIAEQKLTLTGIVDPTSAKQLGKILGVDAIVSGSITNLAQSIRVNARLISTETGEVFAVASADIFKDESVTQLLSNRGSLSKMASPSPLSESAVKPKPQRVTVNEFMFELDSCKMSAETVICYLTIRNERERDRSLTLSGSDGTRLFDESGNEYIATAAWIGAYGNKASVYTRLVPQVAVKASVKFEDVSSQASKVSLSLAVDTNPGGLFGNATANFRNIPLAK